MVAIQLQASTMRTALQLHREPPCCSGRGVALGPSGALLGGRDIWACRQHAARRLSAARAEFSRDPRGGGGAPGSGGGPATQQQTYQQQPWGPDSYAYPPQTSTPPPRLPPNGNNGGGPEGGGGGGGASNLTRAFIAGAFILGGLPGSTCLEAAPHGSSKRCALQRADGSSLPVGWHTTPLAAPPVRRPCRHGRGHLV